MHCHGVDVGIVSTGPTLRWGVKDHFHVAGGPGGPSFLGQPSWAPLGLRRASLACVFPGSLLGGSWFPNPNPNPKCKLNYVNLRKLNNLEWFNAISRNLV